MKPSTWRRCGSFPSTPHDAKGMLLAAIDDPDPVMVFEHKLLYKMKGEVPEEAFRVPIGKAHIARPGSHVTVVATSIMVHRSLEAAEALAAEGIDVEVIDLRTLRPMDTAAKIAKWHVKEGGTVTKGAPLFEIETDKAAMEIEAPASGILRNIVVGEGASAAVGRAVAYIYAEGEAAAVPAANPEVAEAMVTISRDTPRARKLVPSEYQGGMAAISNLGMLGIEQFTAIINPPQATILAVGAGIERFVPVNGQPALKTQMICTLSCDHRAVDGTVGAELLQAFRSYTEEPMLMLA